MLKREGIHVTATAVYDLMQAYMALAAKADYIAPYVNRIGNLGSDPNELIFQLRKMIDQYGYSTKILAASFKGVQQMRDALNEGAHALTAPVALYQQIFANPSIDKAVTDNLEEVKIIHGVGTGRLRKAIWEHLKRHKNVGSLRLGKYGEGETGVTFVKLK